MLSVIRTLRELFKLPFFVFRGALYLAGMSYIDLLISVVLALIMFAIGSSLTVGDYRNIFRSPKALTLGLVLQMLFLPLLAIAILPLSDLDPSFQAGLFVLTLCPGGTTSNFISYLVKADVALSISLTSINSFIILFSIPFFTSQGLPLFLDQSASVTLSFWDTMQEVFLVILLPAAIGLWFNARFPLTSQKLQTPLKYTNIALLALVFGIKFFAGEQSGGSGLTGEEILTILPMALLIHGIALLVPFGLGQALRLRADRSVTIGIEVGLQNTTLALLVTGSIIGSNAMMKPVLVYALFSFFTTTAFAFLARRWSKRRNG